MCCLSLPIFHSLGKPSNPFSSSWMGQKLELYLSNSLSLRVLSVLQKSASLVCLHWSWEREKWRKIKAFSCTATVHNTIVSQIGPFPVTSRTFPVKHCSKAPYMPNNSGFYRSTEGKLRISRFSKEYLIRKGTEKFSLHVDSWWVFC